MRSSLKASAVVLCGGVGARTGLTYNKILHYIGKKTVLEHVLCAFRASEIGQIAVVYHPLDRDAVANIVRDYDDVVLTEGGDTRTQSVQNGLRALRACDIVAIHDGARPFVTSELINATVRSATKYGSGIAAVRATDTVRPAENGVLRPGPPRHTLWHMQTPQTFSYPLLIEAYEKIQGDYTDDAEVFMRAGHECRIVEGDPANRKITTQSDIFACDANGKIGTGFDVHPFAEGRKLILGGVTLDYPRGLLGHSDADALTHAIMDAMLSAAGLRDIGVLFPDDDPATENIGSFVLLDRVAELVREKGYAVRCVSAVILAQAPKMAPYIPQMRVLLAERLHISLENIDISATTTERLGIIGEEKGIAASAVAQLTKL